MKIKLIVLILFSTIVSSCRFSRPILVIPTYRQTTTDSTTKYIQKDKGFIYINFRPLISLGKGSVIKTYLPSGQLIKRTVLKESRMFTDDGNKYYYLKEITYDALLNRQVKNYFRIKKNHGRSSTTIYEKTIEKIIIK